MKKGEVVSYRKNGREYSFTLTRDAMDRDGKSIYIGVFRDAVDGLTPNREYVLIEVKRPGAQSIPAAREVHDLLPFSGDHLREVLSRDDAGQKWLDQWKQTGSVPTQTGRCMFVEPLYQEIRLTDGVTVYERLELFHQMCLAEQELHALGIEAHRDMKRGNFLMEQVPGGFRVRLIDMASVSMAGTAGTYHGAIPFSRENTPPEALVLDGTVQWGFGPKTDLFALGGILGELLGTGNPISAWSCGVYPGAMDDAGYATVLAERFTELELRDRRERQRLRKPDALLYRRGDRKCGWLEYELGDRWSWKIPCETDTALKAKAAEALQKQLSMLLAALTQIDPKNRPTIEEVLETVESLGTMLEQAGLDGRSGLGGHGEAKGYPLYCLLDQVEMDREIFLGAFGAVWRAEQTRAGQQGAALAAMVGAFNQLGDDEANAVRKEPRNLSRYAWLDAVKDLPAAEALLKGLQPVEQRPGQKSALNMLLGGDVYGMVTKNSVPSTVHIFTSDVRRLSVTFGKYSTAHIVEELRKQNPDIRLVVHSATAPGATPHWYDELAEMAPEPDPVPEPPKAHFYEGVGGLFVRVNGREIPVGILEDA